jgi:hypothetical protein
MPPGQRARIGFYSQPNPSSPSMFVPRSYANWLSLLLLIILSSAASSRSPEPVGRTTSDRDADLIEALIRVNRFDDALGICRSQLRAVDSESDSAAKWVIRQSQILTARQMMSERFEQADVQAAGKPTVDLLASYPQHRRRQFLEAQNIAVEHQAAVHGVLRVAVSPADEELTDAAFKRLLRATTKVVALSDDIGDDRSQLDSRRGAREFALIADLIRLQQELQVDAVSMALMQTELFPRGSDDCIAAASKAEQAANAAIAKLPADSSARREIERLSVEAILRGGQLSRAETDLAQLVRLLPQPIPAPVQAMQVRLDLARGRMQQAESRLAVFYGDSPATGPQSIEMDLARLDYLMQSGNSGALGGWLDAIEQRGGAYARRRAEAVSLSLLRSTGNGAAADQMVDPSLVAAQGQDWLRRGNPGRAGDLLSAAAKAESDPDRAIRHASEAAAALVAADRRLDAAQILADVSAAKPSGSSAPAAHLQAAVLIAEGPPPQSADRIESLLKATTEHWPASRPATAARKWLIKLLSSQQRFFDAAEVATQIPSQRISLDEVRQAVELWRSGFRSVEPEQWSASVERFQDSFRPLLSREDIVSQYVIAATLLLDRGWLDGLPKLEQGTGAPFIDALLAFRESGAAEDALGDAPAELISDASWRLMRDGRSHPRLRAAIALQIGHWIDTSTPSLEQAERLLWQNRADDAVAMLRALADQAPDSAEIMKRAAELLGSADQREARQAAIGFWDQLAAGAPKGGLVWHQAKIAAIRLLSEIGKQEEARRRTRYILLTMPSIESTWKQQYEAETR